MNIRKLLQGLNPKICPYKIMNKKGYGFQKEKPIMVKSVAIQYEIIERLQLKDCPYGNYILKDITKESLEVNGFTGFVDHYEIMYNVYTRRGMVSRLYDLYFCVYPKIGDLPYTKEQKIEELENLINNKSDIKVPKGFHLKFIDPIERSNIVAVG